ncbi:hypothetical protein [Bosea caraganae]|uniref:hypothetical protein n=1 Tax=Bosea caraganae TaxID=2763117 RepID=UPI0015F06DE4|nr:hypothetical protein [Bosea caraganae]
MIKSVGKHRLALERAEALSGCLEDTPEAEELSGLVFKLEVWEAKQLYSAAKILPEP